MAVPELSPYTKDIDCFDDFSRVHRSRNAAMGHSASAKGFPVHMAIRPASSGSVKAQLRKNALSKQPQAQSLLQLSKTYALKHTWLTPLVILIISLSLYAVNPTTSNPLRRFIFLSYPIPPAADAAPGTPIQYGKGMWDYAFVAFYMVVLSFTREFIMQEILQPMAIRNGLKSSAKQARFMEQMYTAIYFGIIGPVGLYVMSRTPVWYFNTRGMYEGFPHMTLEADFKFYYLFQAAYWAQQFIVMILGLEKPRKDYHELIAHHIVTLVLIAASYRFHFTYMGIGVFITHDLSDFFFATSKTLNYLKHPLTAPYFAFFICTWVYLRHYLNLRILWSEFHEFKTVGPYVLDWAGEQFKCPLAHYISTALLGSLQALNLFWLFLICRVVYRSMVSGSLEDERSDNEEDDQVDALDSHAVGGVPGAKVLPKVEISKGSSSARHIQKDGVMNRRVSRG